MSPWTILGWLIVALIAVGFVAAAIVASWLVRVRRAFARDFDQHRQRMDEVRADIERGGRPSGKRFKL